MTSNSSCEDNGSNSEAKSSVEFEEQCVPMGAYEEEKLLLQLNKTPDQIFSDLPEASRLKRKLALRRYKRKRGLEVFDIDKIARNLGLIRPNMQPAGKCLRKTLILESQKYLDRFQIAVSNMPWKKDYTRFHDKLLGQHEDRFLECFLSPHTGKILKPVIWQDYHCKPRFVQLLNEIEQLPGCDKSYTDTLNYPVNYYYLRPWHVSAINSLCREHFWPGIDVTECLEYPDYTCVAQYKKLIIGFAVLIPDATYNAAYLSYIFVRPHWRGAGIAQFMLYHLMQSCPGKDITLHTAADNTAVFLYHKFGFKIEEYVADFYDKYLPVDSKACRDAVFFRLTRMCVS